MEDIQSYTNAFLPGNHETTDFVHDSKSFVEPFNNTILLNQTLLVAFESNANVEQRQFDSSYKNSSHTYTRDNTSITDLNNRNMNQDNASKSGASKPHNGSRQLRVDRASERHLVGQLQKSPDRGKQSTLPTRGESVQRQEFLARNRCAATKSRRKKKRWEENLQERYQLLLAERNALIAAITVLKHDILTLKTSCLEHVDCSCESIRFYLQRAAACLPSSYAQSGDTDKGRVSNGTQIC